jgi:hypothetical protein
MGWGVKSSVRGLHTLKKYWVRGQKLGPTIIEERRKVLPENRIATHPGEILKEEFLDPAGITQVGFAQHIGVSL